jgi:hypothetical protein
MPISKPTRSAATRRSRILAVATLLVAVGVSSAAATPGLAAPAPATPASAGDRAATRIYIQANYRLVHAARIKLSASEVAVRALVSRTVAECPHGGEGSYVDKASNEFAEEVINTVLATGYRPDIASLDAFVHTVQGLHWSNRRLTRIVRTYLAKLRNLAALVPANICADVKTWAADGFQALPEDTIQFNKLALAADVEAEEVPLRLLAPYEGPRQAALLHRTKRLEGPLAEAEARAVEQWMDIMRGLSLSV